MRLPLFVSGAVSLLTAAGLLPSTVAIAEDPAPACEPAGQYGFVCGLRNPEDLVLVPGTRWIISSGMAPDGAIYLVDAGHRTWTELYPGEAPRARQDMDTYGACPGAPVPGGFVSHGLNIRPGPDGPAVTDKRRLGRLVADRFHGPGSGAAAEEYFNRVTRDHQAPDEIPEVTVPAGDVHLPALLVDHLREEGALG